MLIPVSVEEIRNQVTVLIFTHSVSLVGIKKKSKVLGVMITQFIVAIPEGKSHADFIRKPTVALTIQEVMLLLSLLTNVFIKPNLTPNLLNTLLFPFHLTKDIPKCILLVRLLALFLDAKCFSRPSRHLQMFCY